MKSFSFFQRVSWVVLLFPLFCSPVARAQEGSLVTVYFSGAAATWYPSPGTLGFGVFEELTSSNPANPGRGFRSSSNTGYGYVVTPWRDVRVELGRIYHINVSTNSGIQAPSVSFTIKPPPNYRIEIQGVERTILNNVAPGSYEFRVMPTGDAAPARAGSAKRLSNGRLYWEVALGALPNGTSAGSLGFSDSGYGSDWSTLFTPNRLTYYRRPGPSFSAFHTYLTPGGSPSPYIPGALRQVFINDALVDIIPLTTESYEIRFYDGAGLVPSSFPYDVTGKAPFVVYLIEKPAGSTNKLRITSKTFDASGYPGTPIRTAVTDVERSGTWPNYAWTANDWNTSGQAQLVQEVRNGASDYFTSNQDYGYTSSYVLQNPSASGGTQIAEEGANSYRMFPWGEELTATRRGPVAAGLTTAFDYYTDANNLDSYARLKSVAGPGGAWEAYEYYGAGQGGTTDGGLRIHRPYFDSPATPPSDLAANTKGIITKYWFAPSTRIPLRLTKVETTTDGTFTGRTEFDYADGLLANNWAVVRTSRYDSVENAAGTRLKTVTRHYRQDQGSDGLVSGQILSIERPDSSKVVFLYQRGTWNGTSFTTDGSARGANGDLASQVATIHGTTNPFGATPATGYNNYSFTTSGDSVSDDFYLVAGRSTMELSIRDTRAHVVRTETRVWNGSSWQTVSFENINYNVAGLLTSRTSANGTVLYSASYAGEFSTTEKDASNVTLTHLVSDYDAAGRIAKSTREGFGSGATLVPELQTAFEYDAASRILKQTSGTAEKLISSHSYDTAGRLTSETTPGQGTTGITYDAPSRTRTVTLPTTKTSIETRNADGSLASVTGSGVIPRYLTHSIESDGRRYTRVNVSTASNSRKVETWTDWLGRTLKVIRPGFSGSSQPSFVEESFYNSAGQLGRTTRTGGYADLLYAYDSMGRLRSSGLDLTTPGQTLDPASNDRLTETTVDISPVGSDWWLTETATRYLVNGSASAPAITRSKTRLSGFTSGQLAETRLVDAENNETVQTTTVDPTNRLVTTTTTRTGLTTTAVEVQRNGLAASTTGFDGRAFTTQYDALLRPWKTKDLRTGDTVTEYVPNTGLVSRVTSPATTTVNYEYDSIGRVIAVKNQDNKYSRTAYDDLSRPYRQWGEATLPSQLEYNEYGEQNKLTTWRGTDAIWSATTWPASPPAGVQQVTQWNYDAASGLLASKAYPAADPASPSSVLNQPQSVTFNYNERGQLSSRTWARGSVTNYTYEPTTGDLTSITYPDASTANVSYSYTRTGQISTITDATGIRTLAYDPAKPWRLDREEFSGFYGSRWLSALYQTGAETNGMAGRDAGFQLGTSGSRAADLEQKWQFYGNGNLQKVLSAYGGGSPRTFTYGYVTNSSLQETLSVTNPDTSTSPFSVTRVYDPSRDLVTSIESKWSSASLVKFAYGYTARGQRDWEQRGGSAFTIDGQVVGTDYQYDDRGELTKALVYLGTNLADSSKKIPNLQHEFAYDNAGNRTSANQTGDPARAEAFAPNNINQLSSRENKSVIAAGTAGAGVTIATQLGAAAPAAADRQGSYWSKAMTPDNATDVAEATVNIFGGNASNQAHAQARTSYVGARLQAFVHDADGNLTSDGLWNYAYDAENRLTSMTTTAAALNVGAQNRRIEFLYDALGRRVQKMILTDSGGGWTPTTARRYLYDGWNLVAEFDAPGGTSCGTLLHSYTWGLDTGGSLASTGGAGALLQITRHTGGAASLLPAFDGNGNVAALYDAAGSGSAVAIYEYSPFGELLRAEGSYAKENPFRFSTKFTDDETGLVNYGHRYYAPSLGRFINRDPIEEAGGANLFGFCGNDAINGVDVLGLDGSNDSKPTPPSGSPGLFSWMWGIFTNGWGTGQISLQEEQSLANGPRQAQSRADAAAARAQKEAIDRIQAVDDTKRAGNSLEGHVSAPDTVTLMMDSEGAIVPTIDWFRQERGQQEYLDRVQAQLRMLNIAILKDDAIRAYRKGDTWLSFELWKQKRELERTWVDHLLEMVAVAIVTEGIGEVHAAIAGGGRSLGIVRLSSLERVHLMRVLRLRERMLALGEDAGIQGFNEVQGLAGVRLESYFGRELSAGKHPGIDFVDNAPGGFGNISLKGPLPLSGKGDLEGLARSVLKDMRNTATNTVIVDVTGLSPTQLATLKSAIQSGAQGSSKTVIYFP